jgi:hypothetical protein
VGDNYCIQPRESTMPLLTTLLLLFTATSAPVSELDGYYALDTTINGSPAQMGVRITHPEGKLLVEVFPAMGGGPIKAAGTLDGNKLRASASVHDGVDIVLELEFAGDNVKGTWRLADGVGLITGKKARDPVS